MVAAGCASTPAPPDVASGSRLRAVWQVADGTRRLVGWHDTQLDLDCEFGLYQHGRAHRCLPDVAQVFSYYADPACTEPVALSFTTDPPHYAVSVPIDTCTTDTTIYALGDEVVQVYGDDPTGACVPQTAGVPAYRLGATVPVTTFVGATEQPDGDQLWLVADDGARAPWAGWDGTRAVAPTRMPDGFVRWAPWIVAYAELIGTYADAACTEPTADWITDIGYCPIDAVLAFTETPCGGIAATFSATGDRVSSPHRLDGDTCVPTTNPADIASISIGPAFADTSWPAVDEVVIDDGGGTIGVHYAVLDGTPIRQTGTNIQFGGHGPPANDYFVDNRTREPCFAGQATDGRTRCLPYPYGGGYYLDAACTEPAVLVAPAAIGCGGRGGDGIPAHYAQFTDDVVHVWAVGAKVAPAVLHGIAGDACVELPLVDGYDVYATGDELAPDRFPEITRAVD